MGACAVHCRMMFCTATLVARLSSALWVAFMGRPRVADGTVEVEAAAAAIASGRSAVSLEDVGESTTIGSSKVVPTTAIGCRGAKVAADAGIDSAGAEVAGTVGAGAKLAAAG